MDIKSTIIAIGYLSFEKAYIILSQIKRTIIVLTPVLDKLPVVRVAFSELRYVL